MNLVKNKNSIQHVAIIMDGNGRWATMRSRPRFWGHIRGSSVVSDIVEAADECGVSALTMYAFSSENWCRPQTEVLVLFNLLHKFLKRESVRILKNNIRFKVMGDITNLPPQTKKLITQIENESQHNSGLKLTFAFGYGGRAEITFALNRFIKEHPGTAITEEELAKNLMIPDLGDVDLLIRTGGDFRVSNFLLWQIAYAELYFTETQWPNFNGLEFKNILNIVSKRERRFGATNSERELKTNIELAERNKNLLKG